MNDVDWNFVDHGETKIIFVDVMNSLQDAYSTLSTSLVDGMTRMNEENFHGIFVSLLALSQFHHLSRKITILVVSNHKNDLLVFCVFDLSGNQSVKWNLWIYYFLLGQLLVDCWICSLLLSSNFVQFSEKLQNSSHDQIECEIHLR